MSEKRKMVTIYKIYKDAKWRIRTRVPETSKILKGQHSKRYSVHIVGRDRDENKGEGGWIAGLLILIVLIALLMLTR